MYGKTYDNLILFYMTLDQRTSYKRRIFQLDFANSWPNRIQNGERRWKLLSKYVLDYLDQYRRYTPAWESTIPHAGR